jgi:hypothetical protein
MTGLTVPVVALSKDGQETSDRVVGGRPCIRIGFAWELKWPNPNDPSIQWTYGEIDTGADAVIMDLDFANPGARLPLRTVEAQLASGTMVMPVYKGTLMVADGSQSFTIETEFAAGKIGPPYRMLLGRLFLARTTFTYNRSLGIESITID